MKLSFLLFVIPFVAAGDSMDKSGALLDESQVVVLADLDRRSSVQPAYCYSPTPANYNCYR
jgi:hypothetical protein